MARPRERGRPAHPDVLTPAEWRVVEAVRHGLRNREIAAHQGVSLDAVKFHVANALQKLNLPGRRELRRCDGIRRDSNLFRKECPMEQEVRLHALGQISSTVRGMGQRGSPLGDHVARGAGAVVPVNAVDGPRGFAGRACTHP